MTIIALIVFGFALLAFAIIFRARHTHSVDQMMKQNHNVMPLFKERSAGMKYQTLHDALKDDPTHLPTLEQLQRDFKDGVIDLDAYNNALDELTTLHLKH